MQSFEGNTGRKWQVAVTVDTIKRVKALLDVDLLETLEGKLLDRLIGNPVLLCDILYVVCRPQADEAGVTDEQFGQAMAGDGIDAATAGSSFHGPFLPAGFLLMHGHWVIQYASAWGQPATLGGQFRSARTSSTAQRLCRAMRGGGSPASATECVSDAARRV